MIRGEQWPIRCRTKEEKVEGGMAVVFVAAKEEEEKRSWALVGVPVELRRRRMVIGGVVESYQKFSSSINFQIKQKNRVSYTFLWI